MAVDDDPSADATKKSSNRSKHLKRTVKAKIPNEFVGTENQKLPQILRKPLIIWNKTTLIRTALGVVIFTLIPFVWWLIYDVRPTLRAVNRMTGEWNVAITSFANLNTDLKRSDILLISNIFSNRFTQEMDSRSSNSNLVVQIWGPQQVDQPISGNTVEKRAIEAEKLADKLNADLLIYGTIQKADNGYALQPEFYLRAANNFEADELVGQHRFGGPISITATRDTLPTQLPLNIELTRRSEILSLVARGLILYLVNSYEQALVLFTKANQDSFWQNADGRESIYLFQGNAAIRTMDFEKAQNAYAQAVRIEPRYARGYVGLGNVTYLMASESSDQQGFTPNQRLLAEASGFYQQALQAEIQPASAEIPSKVAFGLGQIYLAEWFTGRDTRDQALAQFKIVLDNYADGKNIRLQELASETHARMAIIYRQDGEAEKTLAELQIAFDLSTLPARRGLYSATMGDLYEIQGKAEQALQANRKSIEQYQLAVALPVPNELKAGYWMKIGERYEALKDAGQAINAYKQALSLLAANSSDYLALQQRLDSLEP